MRLNSLIELVLRKINNGLLQKLLKVKAECLAAKFSQGNLAKIKALFLFAIGYESWMEHVIMLCIGIHQMQPETTGKENSIKLWEFSIRPKLRSPAGSIPRPIGRRSISQPISQTDLSHHPVPFESRRRPRKSQKGKSRFWWPGDSNLGPRPTWASDLTT